MVGSIRKAMERGLCFLLLPRGEEVEEVSFITLAESHAGSG